MGNLNIKINESNLIHPDYHRTCNLSRYMPDITPEQAAQLESAIWSARRGTSLEGSVTTPAIFEIEEKTTAKPPKNAAPKTTTTVSQPKTAAEKAVAAEKRALNAAKKKNEKQRFCVLDPIDLLSMSVTTITAELVEFFEKNPDDPTTWDKILVMLADLGVFNAAPYVKCNKQIPETVLKPIIQHIFSSKRWTSTMLTCLNHYKSFFSSRDWKNIKHSFYQAVYALYVRISPAEDVAKVSHLKKLPQHIFNSFRPFWDFLWKVPLVIW